MAILATLSPLASLGEQLVEHGIIGRVLLYGALVTLAAFAFDVLSQTRYPASIPAAGHGRGLIAWFRNAVGYVGQHRQWAQDGYAQHAAQQHAFLLPTPPARPYEIVLPRSQTAWLLDQPDSVVSAADAHNRILHGRYNFLGSRLAADVFHTRVVHRHLARHLPALIPEIARAVREAVDDAFGYGMGQKQKLSSSRAPACRQAKDNVNDTAEDTTDDWTEINLWDAFIYIVPRVTNRIIVGQPVCRDESFLSSMVAIADLTVRNSFLLSMVPRVLHPIVGWLVTIPNRRHWRTAHRAVAPIITARLRDMLGANKKADYIPPEDFITWTIRQAVSENNSFELNPETISKRLVPVEFAAIHTTVLTLHSLLLDILSSPHCHEYIDGIADEARQVLAGSGHDWTKSSLLSLHRADSAIRESQRLSTIAVTLVQRRVVALEGLHNPVEGWTAPQGSWFTLNLTGLHHDDDIYDNANTYDAFRFSRMRDELERQAAKHSDDDDDATIRAKRLGMVTTSDAHIPFGHGRHAW